VASFTVDRMQSHQQPAVIGALVRAFYDDPLFGFFAPNLVRQTKMAMSFMSSGVKDAAPFGEIHSPTSTARSSAPRCGCRPARTRAACAAT
jgi:hypothetical protein